MTAGWEPVEVLACAVLAVGALLAARASAWARGRRDGRWWVALAVLPALGPGLISVAWFLSLIVGVPSPALSAAGLTVLVWGITVWHGRGTLEGTGSVERVGSWWCIGWGVLAATAVAFVLHWHQLRPEGSWDAMAIWNYHARLLARGGMLAGEVLSVETTGAPDYPLHLSAAVAALWNLAGEEGRATPVLVASMYLAGIVGMLHIAVETLTSSRRLAMGATALLLSTPAVLEFTPMQLADVVVAWCLLAAAAGLAMERFTPGGRRNLLLFGFSLGLLPWTKNEGVPLALLVYGAFLFSDLRRPGCRRRQLLLVVGAALPLLATVWFKLNWAPTNWHLAHGGGGWWDRFTDGARWAAVMAELWGEVNPLIAPRHWGGAWVVVIGAIGFAAVTRRRGHPVGRLLGVMLAGALALWPLALVLSPRPEWQIHVLDRLLFQTFPLALLWAAVAVSREPNV